MRLHLSAFLGLLGGLFLGCATASAQAPKRVALVIGNGEYRNVGTLQNADRDASALAAALGRLGFEVKHLADADRATMREALTGFQLAAFGADTALVFYAGHSLRHRGTGRLVPVDATLKDTASIDRETLPLDEVNDALGLARNAFLLVDGCGDGQVADRLRRTGGLPGLGKPTQRPGALIAFGWGEERTCASRLFIDSLLVEIEAPGIEAQRLFGRTRQLVAHRSSGAQEVAVAGDLDSSFFFARDDLSSFAFRHLGVDPGLEAMRSHVEKHGNDVLTSVVKAMLTEKEAVQAKPGAGDAVRNWNQLIDESWNRAREEKARVTRREALEARWNREAEAERQGLKEPRLAALTPTVPTPPPTPAVPPPPIVVEKAVQPPAPKPIEPTSPPPAPQQASPSPPVPPTPPPQPPAAAPEPKIASLPALPALSPPSIPAAPEKATRETSEPAEKAGPSKPPETPAPVAETKPATPSSPPPSEPTPAPAEPKVASLPPPEAAPPSAPPFNPDSVESVRAAQQELKRLGCYLGGVDGVTGPQTKNALATANEKLGPGAGVSPLTENGLRTLRGHTGMLCPPPARPAPPVASLTPPTAPIERPAAPAPPPAPAPQVYAPPPAAVVTPPAPPPAAPAPEPAAPARPKIRLSM